MSPPPAVAATLSDLPLVLPRQTAVARAPKPPQRQVVVAAPATAALPAVSERALVGIGLVMVSTIFFACSDIAAKMLIATMPAVEVAWIRFAVFLVIMLPLTAAAGGKAAFVSARPGLQVLRGLGMVCSSLFVIAGLKQLSVADSTATNFVAPLFITALSVIFLRESVGIRRWTATAVGLVGVIVVVRPGPDVLQSAALLPAAGALCWAVAAIATRTMAGTDKPETTLFYSAIVGTGALSLLVPFVWVTPTGHELVLAVIVGSLSTVGHWLLVRAFRHASASVLAPFSYVQLVWAIGLGYVMLGTLPTMWTIVGGSLIAASGLYTAHREQVRARAARPATA